MKKSVLYFALIAAAFVRCSTPEQANTLVASIDSIMTSAVDTAKFNGNVLVAKNGVVVYQKSFGLANYDTGEKLNDSSLFELASVSKQFTAMGIMKLKESGLLSYDDDIRKYLPAIPYEGMTVRHLLTHTSGLPEYEQLFVKPNWDSTKIVFNNDIIALLAKVKPPVLFAPGEKWEYSNTGYALLASIIEAVSGKSYGEFLAENIFKPLNMTRTRTYNTRRSTHEIIPNYAYGFVYSDRLQKYSLPDSLSEYYFVITLDGIEGDGIVNSTTGDLFKWNEALYTDKLIKPESLEEAFTPVKLNNDSTYHYGFGWGIETAPTGRVVVHTGSWPGYRTFIKRYLDTKDCIIVLSNNESRRSVITREISKRLER